MFSYSRLLQWFPKYFYLYPSSHFFYSTAITRGIFFRGQSYHIFHKVLLMHLRSTAILGRIVTTILIVALKFCMFCPSLLLPCTFYWVFFFSSSSWLWHFVVYMAYCYTYWPYPKNLTDCWTQIHHSGPIHTRKGLSGWLPCFTSSMKTFQIFLTIQGGLGLQPLIPHSFTRKEFVISNSDSLSVSPPIPPLPSILYRHFLLQNFCTFNL